MHCGPGFRRDAGPKSAPIPLTMPVVVVVGLVTPSANSEIRAGSRSQAPSRSSRLMVLEPSLGSMRATMRALRRAPSASVRCSRKPGWIFGASPVNQ